MVVTVGPDLRLSVCEFSQIGSHRSVSALGGSGEQNLLRNTTNFLDEVRHEYGMVHEQTLPRIFVRHRGVPR